MEAFVYLEVDLAPDYRLHFPGMPGPVDGESHKQLVMLFRSAFPDWTETVEDVIGELA